MKEKRKIIIFGIIMVLTAFVCFAANPVIQHMFTADPAALVYNDRVYIYTGHDEAAEGHDSFVMRDWHVFSSSDMVNWTDHGAVLRVSDFSWASADAWAGHCVYRDGKFYWYVPMSHKTINGFSIGVAVSDSPTGPFQDARGSAIITNNMTTDIAQCYVGISTCPPEQAADTNCDGTIDIIDALLVAQYYVGLITEFC
jgi:beta-xylosidase